MFKKKFVSRKQFSINSYLIYKTSYLRKLQAIDDKCDENKIVFCISTYILLVKINNINNIYVYNRGKLTDKIIDPIMVSD